METAAATPVDIPPTTTSKAEVTAVVPASESAAAAPLSPSKKDTVAVAAEHETINVDAVDAEADEDDEDDSEDEDDEQLDAMMDEDMEMDEDELKEIEAGNILESRTRGVVLDFAKISADLPVPLEDDDNIEEDPSVEHGGRIAKKGTVELSSPEQLRKLAGLARRPHFPFAHGPHVPTQRRSRAIGVAIEASFGSRFQALTLDVLHASSVLGPPVCPLSLHANQMFPAIRLKVEKLSADRGRNPSGTEGPHVCAILAVKVRGACWPATFSIDAEWAGEGKKTNVAPPRSLTTKTHGFLQISVIGAGTLKEEKRADGEAEKIDMVITPRESSVWRGPSRLQALTACVPLAPRKRKPRFQRRPYVFGREVESRRRFLPPSCSARKCSQTYQSSAHEILRDLSPSHPIPSPYCCALHSERFQTIGFVFLPQYE
ncbi:hypothetical protein BDK51DRAFT_30883 [Blyttiomyces helicus]|uniref:Histone chaperone domain-containing protein n=1 Tax=Blyttiomyces helicus TaxID=388810 RepID=A0A4P9WDU1_9FUNG|nr:hypothetical protein BDK51DRAFT_30883 [Blyttiomyces helicus]|eukprot:RKO90532.1 hypothetical protein BDK51DRAFT_30883 [Blyttiomyces helicus]